MINVLSLFDWISCARVALDRAWFSVRTYYASEIDKYANKISQTNYPDIIRLWDVKCFDNDLLGYWNWKWIDLLIWWSPCQDLSIAKKNRKWLDGEKSSLFWEYVRILKIIKPRCFLLENVASMSKENQDIISKALGVDPIMINAALVSAQQRKRLFWTNIKWVTQPEDRKIFLKDILEDNVNDIFSLKTWWNFDGLNRFEKALTFTANSYESNNKPIRVWQLWKWWQWDRIYSPLWKSVSLSANGWWRWAKTGLYETSDCEIRKLTPIECERLQWLPDWYTDWVSNTQRYKMLWNAFNVDVVAHILSFIKE